MSIPKISLRHITAFALFLLTAISFEFIHTLSEPNHSLSYYEKLAPQSPAFSFQR
jgi:hypothetical protein